MRALVYPNWLRLLTTLSLLLGVFILMQTAALKANPTLVMAVSIDLILSIPLIHFLLIRKTSIPNTTALPVLLLGLLLGSLFLPKEQQTHIALFKNHVLPFIELFVVGYIVYKLRKAIRTFKLEKGTTPDFYTALKQTCRELLPKPLVSPFITEISVFYYGVVRWRKRVLDANEFSYHKNSGSMALLIAVIFMIAVETFALHLLLARWNVTVAWILSGISIYTGFQVLGFAKSLAQRPIALEGGILMLRYGIMSEIDIKLHNIAQVELNRKAVKGIKGIRKLSPLGELESHNMLIHLEEEVILNSLYGIKRRLNAIALYVDEPQKLKRAIERAQALD